MEMKKVQSSNIEEIGYDAELKELHINFGNSTYSYADVPESLYIEMEKSESVGRFFHTKIKGKFKHKKLPFEKKAE